MTQLLTYDQAAAQLAVSADTVKRMVKRGELRLVHVADRAVRLRADDIERLIKQRTVG